MKLPGADTLPVNILAGVFKNTTNSYKYYWLLALLALRRQRPADEQLSLHAVAIKMIVAAWYPVHFFRLSFGKQDKLAEAVLRLAAHLHNPRNTTEQDLYDWLQQEQNDAVVQRTLIALTRYVPYRFIAPWFATQLRGLPDGMVNQKISTLAAETFQGDHPPPYKFINGYLCLHPDWAAYIDRHQAILEGYTLWHLTLYLQRNNPNVPAIPDKLFPPRERNLVRGRKFWDIYLSAKPAFQCIYSGESIDPAHYSLDHYLPWSFVAHDLLWNLLPVKQEINASKSDNLPHANYLNGFMMAQQKAFVSVAAKGNQSKILEDYTVLFNKSVHDIANMPVNQFSETLKQTMEPLHQIANNMGFRDRWEFQVKGESL